MNQPPTGRALVITFVALIALAATSWIAAGSPALALAIALLKALGIGLVFMELAHAHPVDRVIAVVALMFVVLLCAGTLADVAFR